MKSWDQSPPTWVCPSGEGAELFWGSWWFSVRVMDGGSDGPAWGWGVCAVPRVSVRSPLLNVSPWGLPAHPFLGVIPSKSTSAPVS